VGRRVSSFFRASYYYMSNLEKSIASLRSIERRIKPDAAWVRARRTTLLMQVKNTLPTHAATHRERLYAATRHFIAIKGGAFVWKPIMTLVLFFILATGGSIMSVSAAERAFPGDFLYGLKLASEQARLVWVQSKDEKLKLKMEFTGRRITELKEVAHVRKDGEGVKAVAEILKSDLHTLTEQLVLVKRDATSEQTVEAAKGVDKKATEVMNALQETKSALQPDAQRKVTEAQSAAADTGTKAIEMLIEKHEQSSSTVAISDVTKSIESHAHAVFSMTISNASSSASTSSTMALLVQSLASSTATGATSTIELPKIVGQMKDLTTQVFAEQKAKEKSETPSVPTASSTSITPSASSSSTHTASSSKPGS
ncbi:MAG: DUF5667 domain-containing protein, partial [Patescibacteria group bacterium]